MKFKSILISLIFVLMLSSVLAAPTVSISPQVPNDNQDLTCTVSEVSRYQDMIFEWRVNGNLQSNNLITVDSRGSHFPASLTSGSQRISCTAYFLGSLLGTSTVRINMNPIAEAGQNHLVNLQESVTLDGSRSSDPDGRIVSYEWNFGDSATSSGAVVNHVYQRAGTYFATLRVTDNNGAVSTDTATITVRQGNSNFIIEPLRTFSNSFNRETSGFERGQVLYVRFHIFDSATLQNLPGRADDLIVRLTNRLSRNSVLLKPYTGSSPEGSVANGEITNNGVYYYTLNLPLTDNVLGQNDLIVTFSTARTSSTIMVSNSHPVSEAGRDLVTNVNTLVRFDGGSRSRDLEDLSNLQYLWDFGDNTPQVNTRTATHTYTAPGIYFVGLKVTDSDGSFDVDTLKVTVNRQGTVNPNLPVASFSVSNLNPFIADLVYFDASLSHDSDGNIVNYQWSFGDGSVSYGKQVSHTFYDTGSFTVRLTVIDNSNLKSTATKVITVKPYDLNQINEPNDNDRIGKQLNQNIDFDKQVPLNYNEVKYHSFSIPSISPLNFKPVYHVGDNPVFLIGLKNEGTMYENLNIKFTILNLGVSSQVANLRLSPKTSVLKQLITYIPQTAKPGRYLAKIEVDNRLGDSATTYWQLNIA